MRKVLIVIVLLYAALSTVFSENNSNDFLFDNLSLDDGLPNASVTSIQEDSLGFLWFGTQNGLVRYDGYNFDIWNHDVFNENSLPHGLVQSLFIDENDIIWIGTYSGLSMFDPISETFTNYEHDQDNRFSISNNVVTAISKDNKGKIWVATLGGLNRFDPETRLFIPYYHNENDPGSLMNDIVRSILIDSLGRIWIGNLSGIDLYNEDSDSFTHYKNFPSPYVMKILEVDENTLLIGTWGGGLTKLEISSSQYENFLFDDNRVYTLEKDSHNNIWVGTWGGGLYITDGTIHTIEHLTSETLQKSSISSDTIYSIFNDSSNNLWIGTNGGGAGVFNPYKRDYNFISHDDLDEQSIGLGNVEALLDEEGRDFWMGIYNVGISRFNRETGEIKSYFHSDDELKSTLSNNIVGDFLKDSSGRIWITTNEGLNLYNKEKDIFERINLIPDEDSNASFSYTVLHEDLAGYIWIGSYNDGIVRYNPNTKETVIYGHDPENPKSLSDNLIYSILERENGEFWIGTNNGLNLMDRETGQCTRYILNRHNSHGLNSNAIRVIIENLKGEMWIATGGGGINIFNDANRSFSHLTTKDGLSNNFIVSMIEDLSGTIWAGTKNGLSIIDPETKYVSILNKERGLDTMEFSIGSLLGSDGAVYLGSYGRVYRFEEEGKIPLKKIVGVDIRSIEVNGEIYDGFSMYKPRAEIVLDYNEARSLSFEYVALNYLGTHNTQYSYKLENFDDEWSMKSARRYAHYTNIPPGEYSFQVRASMGINNGGVKGIEQKIIIRPPFWMTWVAYIIYSIVLLRFLYFIVTIRKSRIRKQKNIELNLAHSYLENIIDSMPSILIGIDQNLIIREWNAKAVQTYGLNSDKASGKPLFNIIPDFPLNRGELQRSLNSGEIYIQSERIELKNNGSRYEVFSVYPLNTGGIESAVIRIDDVTKQVKMEEALVQSEKMLSVGGLAAGMAHEINNPLAGMVQNAQVLENRLLKGSNNKHNIKAAEDFGIPMSALVGYMAQRQIPQIISAITESGLRISGIIENMLSFSRKSNTLYIYQNLPEIMDKTIELAASDYNLKKNLDFKSIKITREYDDDLPETICDRSKIQQVFLNILRNGAEAMEEIQGSDHEFTIRIYKRLYVKQIVMEIEDNGPGISLEVQKRIFEPFYTTKPVGIGTGLGLSISYFIIKENHRGDLQVKSSSGKGTTFIISLPIDI